MAVLINWKRAHEVFSPLLDAYEKLDPPYDRSIHTLPQRNFPSNLEVGTVEHVNFLYVETLEMRGGQNSNRAFASIIQIYERYPELFRPSYVVNGNEKAVTKKILRALEEEGLTQKAEEISRFWAAGLKKFELHWEGDPRNLFKDGPDYEEVCRRIICDNAQFSYDESYGFPGLQEKLVSMLIYYLMEAKLIEPFVFPVPADFHILRVLTAHEILYVQDASFGDDLKRYHLAKKAREVTTRYCEEYGVSPVALADVLWLLSRTFCRWHPGNATLQPEGYDARNTVLVPLQVTWDRTQVKWFERSCAICPVEATCKNNIPAAEYYRRGRVVLRGRREEPPEYQQDLFFGT